MSCGRGGGAKIPDLSRWSVTVFRFSGLLGTSVIGSLGSVGSLAAPSSRLSLVPRSSSDFSGSQFLVFRSSRLLWCSLFSQSFILPVIGFLLCFGVSVLVILRYFLLLFQFLVLSRLGSFGYLVSFRK